MVNQYHTIPVNPKFGSQAQIVCKGMGLDIVTVVNILLEKIALNEPATIGIIKSNTNPEIKLAVRPPFQYGSMTDKIWMADDFNAPLDDFEDYM